MRPWLAFAAVIAAFVGGCGDEADAPADDAPSSQQAPADLWGRTFVSTAVTEDGEPRPLVPDTRIEVTFEKREDVVRWRSGCNIFGADVEITADRLVGGQITGTEMGCRRALREQDDWLMDFFGSNPRWQLSDDRLALASEETVVELEEKSAE